MFHLALETSLRRASFCILDGDRMRQAVQLDRGESTSAQLLPAMATAAAGQGMNWPDLALISISCGPGSFTGLRIGVTIARTLAFATGCRIAAVPAHEVIAFQAWQDRAEATSESTIQVASLIDAQRNEWFVELRSAGRDGQQIHQPSRVCGADDLPGNDENGIWWNGPGLRTIGAERIAAQNVCREAAWDPRAETVGLLGWQRHLREQWQDPLRLLPDYGRASAAEERLETAAGNANKSGESTHR